MKADPITMTLLFDEYGALLTEKQRDCCDLYLNEDLSLSEIAGELGISRQGVHDSLTRAEATLAQFESVLGNVARRRRTRAAADEIGRCIQALEGSDEAPARAVSEKLAAALQQLLE